MTEITRVPLQPIAKGSLTKLWVAVAAAVLAAGGIAYAAMPPRVEVDTLRAGSGPLVMSDQVPIINYVGKLKNGKVFDEGQQAPLPLNHVVPGFREGLTRMHVGGKYRLTIPSEKGYGAEDKQDPATGETVIPANSDLVFDIEVTQVVSQADYDRYQRLRQLMQMQQMQQGGAPAPGAETPAHP
jgi:FKBP-type peptidyl-prolyl cis-trans isomerase FkpA